MLDLIFNRIKVIVYISILIFISKAYALTQNIHTSNKSTIKKNHPPEENEPYLFSAKNIEHLKKLLGGPKISGFIQTDYAHYNQDKTKLGDGVIIRRAKLMVSGEVWPNWGYVFSIDDQNGDVKLEENYMSYTGFIPATIKIGNYKEYFSIENLTSSANLTFLERALPVRALAPSYHVGIGIETFGKIANNNNNITAAIGLFGQPVGHVVSTPGANQGGELTGRMTYSYYPKPTRLFMVGLSASAQKPDSDNVVNYSTVPESEIADVTLVNTAQEASRTGELSSSTGIIDARYMGLYDLEAALVAGPFSVQGEYIRDHIWRTGGAGSYNFKGWYLFGSWFLTGESRPFDTKTAIFTNIKPLHSYGAWELKLRNSYINLNSGNISGGKENNITIGLNWYVNPYVRFMADYIFVHASKPLVPNGHLNNNPDIITLRAQVSWG